ncbi:uncharacterized protein [Miscanthus floridulus]|uniref:uncharacterized protein n=1 Tax=Miscanthus floridulus TaxID=154761 RepID=UPI003458E389
MWGAKAASSILSFYKAKVAMLLSLKPDDAVALLPEPPEIAIFRLRCSNSHRGSLSSTPLVACADKGLLVIYGGGYFGPGSSTCGCYLVYSAARLSTVPPPPEAPRGLIDGIGSGAVVLRRCHPGGGGSSSPYYLLAELAIMPKRKSPDPDAVLLLWRSDEPQWARKEVRLPHEVKVCRAPGDDDKHVFYSDTSFSGPGGCLCWVDLLHGIVVCTNPLDPDPELRFIPLPDGCPPVSVTDYPYRPLPEEDRSAACVGGRIKLVAMVGELAGWNANQYILTTWTLSPDLSGWQQDGVFPLKDLWATEEYRELNLVPPQQTPVCPVLSVRDDGEDVVVYAVVNDIEEHPVVQGRQVVLGTELEFKRQYVLGIDVRRNKIVSTSSGVPPESLMQMMPRLLLISARTAREMWKQARLETGERG